MLELLLIAPADDVEGVSDALLDAGALAVTVEDADADSPDEAPIFGEPGMSPREPLQRAWGRSVLKALFEDEAAATGAAAVVLAHHDDLHVQALQAVPDEDWVRITQAQFEPVPITADFWIVPSWHAVPAAARTVMRLDPGLAFGTGTHPTTRMCLGWIARHADARQPWTRALDYGCGSGILAIAAALHGARAIDAVDIDPAAVSATTTNAQANGVTLAAIGLPERAQGLYDVVLANILAAPLKVLAPLLCAHLAPGGHLVLAGLLERQVDELCEAYAPWLDLAVGDRMDGWAMLQARRREPSPPRSATA